MPELKNRKWERFARLIASGMPQTDAYLAVPFFPRTKQSLQRQASDLLHYPPVEARIAELSTDVAAVIASRMRIIETVEALEPEIMSRLGRAHALASRHGKLMEIVEERAADPDISALPGGHTGFIIRRERSVGRGENAQTIVESEVDVPLLAELRAIEERLARELGQEIDRKHISVSVADVLDRASSAEIQKYIDQLESERRQAIESGQVIETEAIEAEGEIVAASNDDSGGSFQTGERKNRLGVVE